MVGNKIVITTSSFGKEDPSPLELLREANIDFQLNPYGRQVTGEELIGLALNTEGLIAGTEAITEDVLQKLDKLKVISRCGSGTDNVDLLAAKRRGIKVFSTPDAPSRAVAELTLGLILNCLRSISRFDRDLRNKNWKKSMGHLLQGKTVGLVGLGRIGKIVASLLLAFEAQVIAFDAFKVEAIKGVKMLPFGELVQAADIITLHIPSNNKGSHFIDSEVINSMKKGSYLINTSRGDVVDEVALYEALKCGKLAGAGIDVYEKEPYNGRLLELENVVLTPHVGSYAIESRILMEKQAVENLLIGLGVKK